MVLLGPLPTAALCLRPDGGAHAASRVPGHGRTPQREQFRGPKVLPSCKSLRLPDIIVLVVYLDLVTVNDRGSASVMMGKPGATFNAELVNNLGPFVNVATVTGDFNGDGIPDVAVLNSAYGTVGLMLGQANGQPPKPQTVRYKTGTLGTAFAVGDVNGDGKLDLLVESDFVNAGYPTFGLLLGNGDGTFQAPRTMSNMCSSGGNLVVLADMNGDGKLDAVTVCGVSLGNGDGTFQNPIEFCSSGTCGIGQKFAIGDFNGDGKLDYAFVTDQAPMSVFVHLGDGTGHMNPTPSYSVNLPYGDTYRNYIAAGHFTANGKLGLVVGSATAGSLHSHAHIWRFRYSRWQG